MDVEQPGCPLLPRALRELGAEVVYVNPSRRPWNPWAKRNPFLKAIDPLRALKVLTRHRDVDAVISIFESGGLAPLLLRRLFLFKPTIALWDCSVGNPWRLLQRIQKSVFARYDVMMMLTRSQIEAVRRDFGPRGELAFIGYNVNEHFYHPKHNHDESHILCIGDDISRDHETFYAAVHDLNHPVVMKTRWRPDGQAPPHVRFIDRRLDAPAFRDLYATAKVVAIALHRMDHAGGITALFEAMAMGKAIVVSDVPMARDFVEDGVSARLVPTGDAEAMRAAIGEFMDRREARIAMGQAARQRLDREFSTSALARRMVEALGERR